MTPKSKPKQQPRRQMSRDSRDDFAANYSRERSHSLEAEQSTLGAMLMERSAIETARMMLKPSDFDRAINSEIFEAIVAVADSDVKAKVDFIRVAEHLRGANRLEECGGAPYISALVEACAGAANVQSYARSVLETSLTRSGRDVAERLAFELGNVPDRTRDKGDVTTQAIIARAMDSLKAQQDRMLNATARVARYSDDTILDKIVPAISWIWKGWIPRGMVTLLAGRPDVGKSTVALDLCSRLIHHSINGNGEWPDGQPIECGDTVFDDKLKLLWVDTERAEILMKQRLDAWEIPRGHFIYDEGRELEPIRIDNDLDWTWLRAAIRDNNVPFVVIDSLAYLYETGSENDNDFMKFVMRRLSDLAAEFNIGLVVIHHLNKLPAGFPDWPLQQDMIRGASAISQFPRSIIGLGHPDKSDTRECGMMSVKLNVAAKPSAMGYRTTEHGPAWGEVPVNGNSISPREQAGAFLLVQLGAGPLPSNDVYEACEQQNICSKRTLDSIAPAFVERYRVGTVGMMRLKSMELVREQQEVA